MRMRDHFLLEPGLVFLNHGSFGACPAEVLEVQQRWQREMERNPVEFLGRRSASLLGAARERLAAAVGSRPEDLVFVSNATTGVNTAARSLALERGDEVVATDHEYGACDAAWEHLCSRAGARLVRVRIPLPFRGEELADRLLEAVTPRTRAIALSHVTSTTALVFPVEEVCRRARERGLLTVVDGAHAPGQVALDLERLDADFYTGNCHKWLCAPKGAAFLWVRRQWQARVEPPVVSWGFRAEGEDLDCMVGHTDLEHRVLWQGTRDVSAFLAVPAAIDFLARHHWDERRADCHRLAVETRARINGLTGLPPIAAEDDVPLMAAVALPPCDPSAVRSFLRDRHRIEIPGTPHGDRPLLRVSFHLYNTRAEADALVEALSELGEAGPV
jgi:isopenicillin-N epimerase